MPDARGEKIHSGQAYRTLAAAATTSALTLNAVVLGLREVKFGDSAEPSGDLTMGTASAVCAGAKLGLCGKRAVNLTSRGACAPLLLSAKSR